MFVERLIGGLAYCLTVVVGFNCIKRKRVVLGLNISIISLIVMAFFYIPGEEADLSRIREMTENWGNFSLGEFFVAKLSDSSVPVAWLLYYVVAKIGVIGVLPAFCTLVFYGNAFHVFKRIDQTRQVNHVTLAISFLIFMASGAFVEVISGVRCFMAFSIVARLAFDEVDKNKTCFLHLPFYVIASLIHSAALVLTLLWLTYSVVRSKRMSLVKFVFNILIIVAALVVIFYFGRSYIDDMLNLANEFLSNNLYSYAWEYLIGFLQVVLYIYILVKADKQGKRDFVNFSIILIVVVIGLCFEYNIFHRFITALSFFMVPMVAVSDRQIYLQRYYDKPSVKWNFLYYFALVILFVACVRGNLCGYKFMLIG